MKCNLAFITERPFACLASVGRQTGDWNLAVEAVVPTATKLKVFFQLSDWSDCYAICEQLHENVPVPLVLSHVMAKFLYQCFFYCLACTFFCRYYTMISRFSTQGRYNGSPGICLRIPHHHPLASMPVFRIVRSIACTKWSLQALGSFSFLVLLMLAPDGGLSWPIRTECRRLISVTGQVCAWQ